MNKLSKIAMLTCVLIGSGPASADDQKLVQYFVNLGSYFGYDVKKSPDDKINAGLLNLASTQMLQTYMFSTLVGSIPVNAFSTALSQIVPEQSADRALNSLANATFVSQAYSNSTSQNQGKVSVAENIDQKNYQPDPVSQTVLNLLTTPGISYCLDKSKAWICTDDNKSQTLFSNDITTNIIGKIPGIPEFYSYDYNQKFLSQLNSNNLTGPLLYSTENPSSNSTSSSPVQKNTGLAADNQAQQANDFIRYVSGSVSPINLPDSDSYTSLYLKAMTEVSDPVKIAEQKGAQATLTNYFANLRTFAAQFSVGVSNLYFIMSKRLPQNIGGEGTEQSSQALNEFRMATWRLFNPKMQTNTQWINQINSASPATVQKEIATLLAEINYQMYLERQIQERILLTNSVMLLQNSRQAQPNPNFNGEPGSAPVSQ